MDFHHDNHWPLSTNQTQTDRSIQYVDDDHHHNYKPSSLKLEMKKKRTKEETKVKIQIFFLSKTNEK